MKGMHALGFVLDTINALMWALVARQPWVAVCWGAIAVGELMWLRYLSGDGAWEAASLRRGRRQ